MNKHEFASLRTYQELDDWCSDQSLINLMKACIEAQKQAATLTFRTTFKPDRQAAADAVSEEKLESILKSGRDVHGIATDRHISNVIVFNARNIQDAVSSSEVDRLRKLVDEAVSEKVKQSFRSERDLTVANSGHFWYPPGAYMAWHTNSGAPGWRMYINHAEESRESRFLGTAIQIRMKLLPLRTMNGMSVFLRYALINSSGTPSTLIPIDSVLVT